ncbi:hypothetical protein GYMLUDRAFT_173826, partial [Collybiopsis luxurians FD-317 M1]
VLPYLINWDLADFETVGENVDFCSQVFEGLQYIHSLNIAHNDAKTTNIMMDWLPLYPKPLHFLHPGQNMDWSGPSKACNQTTSPVKYYFIDWDLSKEYDCSTSVHISSGYGGDQLVPEFRRNKECDPFTVDIYCLGNIIWSKFITVSSLFFLQNVEFLKDLILDKTHDDPSKWPTMEEVVHCFKEIWQQLSWWKLHSHISDKIVPPFFYYLYTPVHCIVQMSYIIQQIPAIPDYTRHRG